MKKQVLTLAVCLAMGATSAFAATAPCVSTKAPQQPAKKASCPKQTIKVPLSVKVAPATATTEALTPEQQAHKRFEAKMAQMRELKYNAINLTAEQRVKADEIDKKHREAAKPLFEKMKTEKTKLKELTDKKASAEEIIKQKQEVKKIKKQLKADKEAFKKEFEAILTADQKCKLKAWEDAQKAQRASLKGEKCPKCGHKHFGKPCSKCDCPPVAPGEEKAPEKSKTPKCNCAK